MSSALPRSESPVPTAKLAATAGRGASIGGAAVENAEDRFICLFLFLFRSAPRPPDRAISLMRARIHRALRTRMEEEEGEEDSDAAARWRSLQLIAEE